MSEIKPALVKTFTVTAFNLKTKLDGKSFTQKLDLAAKIYATEAYYRGYVEGLVKKGNMAARKLTFEWEKKPGGKYKVSVFADPELEFKKPGGGLGVGGQNPPPTGSKPPGL